MVLDTSAIVAILLNEPERHRFTRLIEAAPFRRLSAASRVEATLVIEGRKRDAGRADLDLCLRQRSRSSRSRLSRPNSPARPSAGSVKARDPAALNFGDVFAYALARTTGEPLLFKGDDFAQTDIARAA